MWNFLKVSWLHATLILTFPYLVNAMHDGLHNLLSCDRIRGQRTSLPVSEHPFGRDIVDETPLGRRQDWIVDIFVVGARRALARVRAPVVRFVRGRIGVLGVFMVCRVVFDGWVMNPRGHHVAAVKTGSALKAQSRYSTRMDRARARHTALLQHRKQLSTSTVAPELEAEGDSETSGKSSDHFGHARRWASQHVCHSSTCALFLRAEEGDKRLMRNSGIRVISLCLDFENSFFAMLSFIDASDMQESTVVEKFLLQIWLCMFRIWSHSHRFMCCQYENVISS